MQTITLRPPGADEGIDVTIDGAVVSFTKNSDGSALSLAADVAGSITGTASKSPLGAAAPVNAVGSVGTLTFSGVVSDGELVTIGGRIYEFDTDASVTAGHVLVDVSGGATAPAAVTALVAAITGDTSAVVSAVDGAGDTVDVTALVKGVAGDLIGTTTDCANGAWGDTTLGSGVDGTVAEANTSFHYGAYLYIAIAANTIADANWRRVSLGAAY